MFDKTENLKFRTIFTLITSSHLYTALVRGSGGASQPLLVGHKCVTGGAQAIKLGHIYINEVGHRPHLAPPSRRLWSEVKRMCGAEISPTDTSNLILLIQPQKVILYYSHIIIRMQ